MSRRAPAYLEYPVAEPTDNSLFREIDEDLRHERYGLLWKKYGNMIIAGVVILIGSVAGYQGWKSYDIDSRLADGERFARALGLSTDVSSDGSDAALRAFNELADEGRSGYAMLSRFQAAALMAERGERAAAAAAYDELASDGGIDAVYQGLAVILGALVDLDAADGQALTRRLAPMTADDNPWRYSAKEITALVAQRRGDKARAREIYGALVDAAGAPRGVRRRAGEMLAVLGE